MITLTLVDIVLILFLLFLFTLGFVYGLIHSVGKVVSIIIGIWGAYQYTPMLSEYLSDKYALMGSGLAEIILFILVAGLIMKLVQLIFWIFNWVLDMISFIPFLSFFNRFLGGVFTLVIGGTTIGLALHLILGTNIPFFGIEELVTASEVGPRLVSIGSWLSPGVPYLLDSVKNLIF